MKARSLLLLLLLLLLAGCAARPLPLPRKIEAEQRLYLPYTVSAPNKLGTAGCPHSKWPLGISWCYSWSANPALLAGVETVPMIRDASMIWDSIGGNSGYVMGFNEPDLCPKQACLTPEEAVKPGIIFEQRAQALGKKIVSHAPSSDNIYWLPEYRERFKAHTGRYPHFDVLAMHCYKWRAQPCIEIGKQYVAWARAWGAKEVWVTEFAFVPAWAPDAATEARQFMAWCESEPTVTRCGPFLPYGSCDEYWPDCRPEANPALLTSDDQLTEIGSWYARPAQEDF